MVKKLTEDLKQKNHHVFFDNYFTRYQLLADLEKDGIIWMRDSQKGQEGVPSSTQEPWTER